MSDNQSISRGKLKANNKSIYISPSRPSLNRSNISASKLTVYSNKKGNVSYGQLQLILENVTKIRQKASSQIKQMQCQNHHLHHLIADLTSQLQQNKKHQQKIVNQKIQKQTEMITTIEHLSQKNKQFSEAYIKQQNLIKLVEEQQRTTQKRYRQLQIHLNQIKKQKQHFQSQYTKIIRTITNKNQQRIGEVLWKIENQYPQGLFYIFKQEQQHKHQLQLINQKYQQVQLHNHELQEQNKTNKSLMQKMMEQFNRQTNKIRQNQQEIIVLKQSESQQKLQLEKQLHTYKIQISQSIKQQAILLQKKQQQLKASLESHQHYKSQKQGQINQFNQMIFNLNIKIQQLTHQINLRFQQDKYQVMVNQVCQEKDQYLELLEKVRYLEKFKNQHYFNVEKIQILCKMLDQ